VVFLLAEITLQGLGSTLRGYFCLWNIKKYGYLKAGTL